MQHRHSDSEAAMQALLFILIVVVSYYLLSIVQAVLHRYYGHKQRIRAIFDAHAIRHHGQYPPRKLQTKTFIELEGHAAFYYGIPIAILTFAVYIGFGLLATVAYLVSATITFVWHIYLHRQYHLLESPLDRFAWFRAKRHLHFEHHRNARVNFAVVEFWVDTLMGTRKD
jgi:sterol desaturase/sphingolipid hydroxylase (fatty acid hydroxylase superfamily)